MDRIPSVAVSDACFESLDGLPALGEPVQSFRGCHTERLLHQEGMLIIWIDDPDRELEATGAHCLNDALERRGPPSGFPTRNDGLSGAQELGQLSLREAYTLPRLFDEFASLHTRMICQWAWVINPNGYVNDI